MEYVLMTVFDNCYCVLLITQMKVWFFSLVFFQREAVEPNVERARHPFPVENRDLGPGGVDSQPSPGLNISFLSFL